jgi:hypothetical protein
MPAVSGDFSFNVDVINAGWTRLIPNPADSTIPATAGDRLLLMNNGTGTIYVIKRTHVAGVPSPALPAATAAGALADDGLVAQIYSSQEIALRAPRESFPDYRRCGDYYAWTDVVAGSPLRVDPVN